MTLLMTRDDALPKLSVRERLSLIGSEPIDYLLQAFKLTRLNRLSRMGGDRERQTERKEERERGREKCDYRRN